MKTGRTVALGAVAVALVIGAIALTRPQWLALPMRDHDELRPTRDPNGWKGNYVPTDLMDAMVELDRMLPKAAKQQISELPDGHVGSLHFGLGMALRNEWGLWRHTRLAQYFEANKVLHPDDMSEIVLEAYWAHLKGQPIDAKQFVYPRTQVPGS